MVPNEVVEAVGSLLDFFCTPLGLQVLGTYSCGGATGKASKLRNKGFILSVPEVASWSLTRSICSFFLRASMAVIDDNMHTAWRSVHIEYLRSENGPQ